MTDRTSKTVTETRREIAEGLARNLRQLDLECEAVFVEKQQEEIEQLTRTRDQERDYADVCHENKRLRALLMAEGIIPFEEQPDETAPASNQNDDPLGLLVIADQIETVGGWRIAAIKIRGAMEDLSFLRKRRGQLTIERDRAREALQAALDWAGPMEEAPIASRPAWFDKAKEAMVFRAERATPETTEVNRLRTAVWHLKAIAKQYDGELASEVIRVCVRALLGSPEKASDPDIQKPSGSDPDINRKSVKTSETLSACECFVLDKTPSAYHNEKCPRYVAGEWLSPPRETAHVYNCPVERAPCRFNCGPGRCQIAQTY